MPNISIRRPRVIKGALIELSEFFLGSVPNIIVFQYAPEQFSRLMANRAAPRHPSNVKVINVTMEPGAPGQVERKDQLGKGFTL